MTETTAAATSARPLGTNPLTLDRVSAGYRGTTVLREVTLEVRKSSIVALLGPNGAGKTTLMRAAAGIVGTTGGRVLVGDQDMTGLAPNKRAQAGLCLIPDGRGVFGNLTVRENLSLFLPPWASSGEGVDKALTTFPDIAARMGQVAGTLSGGQQQMLALCRAWICRPAVVLLDEVSMGLAPRIVDEIFERLDQLAADGIALLIVEQYVRRALDIADFVYLLDKGRIQASGAPSQLDQDTLIRGYLGGD